jgi:hypothetical protein
VVARPRRELALPQRHFLGQHLRGGVELAVGQQRAAVVLRHARPGLQPLVAGA